MKMKKSAIALYAAFLVLAGCTTADQKADQAYWAKDYKTAYAEFLPLAQGGDWLADERIAFMYAKGQGVPVDLVQAQQWYEKAAQDGDTPVADSLGDDYLYPQEGSPNYPLAAKWFQVAADRNDPYGQLQLSVLYEQGLGVARDHDTSLHYLNQFVGRTDIVGQQTYFKFSGGDNTGGFMAALQKVLAIQVRRATELHQYTSNMAVLSFHDQDGRAVDVKVDQSTGDPAADAAAVGFLQKTNLPPVLASLARVERYQVAFSVGSSAVFYGIRPSPP
jgi:hypothetical protein